MVFQIFSTSAFFIIYVKKKTKTTKPDMSSQSAACFLACFFSPSVVDDQDLLGVQALGGTALYVLAESPDPAEFVLKSISIVEHARLY